MNNVLSTIDQTQGLLEDFAVGAVPGQAIDPARLENIAARIKRQVRKGTDVMNRLNRLAHSLDDPAGPFDVVAETENLISLSRRFADLKRLRLVFTKIEEEVWAGGNAFVWQRAIFSCVQRIIQASEEGDRIDIGVRREDGEAVVTLVGSARCVADEDDPQTVRLANLMKSVGGVSRNWANEQGGGSFELRIPAASREGRSDGQGESPDG